MRRPSPQFENRGHIPVPPTTHSTFLPPEKKTNGPSTTLAEKIQSSSIFRYCAESGMEIVRERGFWRIEDVKPAGLNERSGGTLGTMIEARSAVELYVERSGLKPAARADTESLHWVDLHHFPLCQSFDYLWSIRERSADLSHDPSNRHPFNPR